jgi:hypothetical protein
MIWSTGTIRIVFSGDVRGEREARLFATDMPFTRTQEKVDPSRIVRIEVDVSNLMNPPPSEEELADEFTELGDVHHSHPFWRKLDRADRFREALAAGKALDAVNWKEQIAKVIGGTPAENADIIGLRYREEDDDSYDKVH